MATDDEDRFFRLLVDRVEPGIARSRRPIFLTGYPASQASSPASPPPIRASASVIRALRCGVELCNGFGELTDPAEQRARFERDQRARPHEQACSLHRPALHRCLVRRNALPPATPSASIASSPSALESPRSPT
ncbi:MAG: hypothetical protein R3F14_10055 [Polyangiaceae bacterium]